MDRERDEYSLINFEETELRLGLPGGNVSNEINDNNINGTIIIIINDDDEANLMLISGNGKRGYSETRDNVDLKLNLSSNSNNDEKEVMLKNKEKINVHSVKPPSKAQVVGWPPVRSCRRNIMAVQKNNKDDHGQADQRDTSAANFVKVSMDGAPYLRKVDLKLYKSYQQLSDALRKMFRSFTVNKDVMKERKLIDLLNGSEYVATYEDKDGDWMLVGDVPWKMFVESCKRLQIMKGSEAS